MLNKIKYKKLLFFILKSSILKSVYYSIKYNGLLLVSRKVKIKTQKNSRIIIAKKKLIVIGLEYDSTTEKVHLVLSENSKLEFLGSANIKKGVQITLGENASLQIGDQTFINERSKIIIYNKCYIGSNCAISWDVTITDSDVHTVNWNKPIGEVFIGNHVWIGFGSSIIKDSFISDGCIVAAHSLVKNKFSTKSLIAGIPATVKSNNIEWN